MTQPSNSAVSGPDPNPPLEFLLRPGPSPRASKKLIWGVIGGIVVIGLLYLVYSPFNRRPQAARTDPSMLRVIPDDELKPDLLSSLAREAKKEVKIEAPKKEAAPREAVPTVSQPSASMAIFVADRGTGISGQLGVPMGTELGAVIEQSVLAGAGATPIVAKLASDFLKAGRVVIPKGSRVFGQAAGSVENQLQVRFSRIVFPNGKDMPFSGVAAVEGYLKGKKGQRALSVISGAAIGSTGVFLPGGSAYGDVFARQAGRGVADEAGRDVSSYRTREAVPVISVRPNKKIVILVDRPL